MILDLKQRVHNKCEYCGVTKYLQHIVILKRHKLLICRLCYYEQMNNKERIFN